MKFRDIYEELKVVKMNLPTKISDFNIYWNDKFENNHDMFSRIKRTGISRKEAVNTIKKGIELLSDRLKKNDGIYILDFSKSKFYLVLYMEKNFKDLNIKTILDYNMDPRKRDTVLTINEAEEYFDVDLSEFYENGFVSSLFGSLLIEPAIYRNELEAHIDEVFKIEL